MDPLDAVKEIPPNWNPLITAAAALLTALSTALTVHFANKAQTKKIDSKIEEIPPAQTELLRKEFEMLRDQVSSELKDLKVVVAQRNEAEKSVTEKVENALSIAHRIYKHQAVNERDVHKVLQDQLATAEVQAETAKIQVDTAHEQKALVQKWEQEIMWVKSRKNGGNENEG